jgi:hypothetical protein
MLVYKKEKKERLLKVIDDLDIKRLNQSLLMKQKELAKKRRLRRLQNLDVMKNQSVLACKG